MGRRQWFAQLRRQSLAGVDRERAIDAVLWEYKRTFVDEPSQAGIKVQRERGVSGWVKRRDTAERSGLGWLGWVGRKLGKIVVWTWRRRARAFGGTGTAGESQRKTGIGPTFPRDCAGYGETRYGASDSSTPIYLQHLHRSRPGHQRTNSLYGCNPHVAVMISKQVQGLCYCSCLAVPRAVRL